MKRTGWLSVAAMLVLASAALVYALTGDTDLSFDPGSGVDDIVYSSVEEHEGLLAMIEGGGDPAEVEQFARGHRLATLEAYLARQR